MFHTAYNSYESKLNGRDYIGKHSTEDPYDDYKGSFKDKEFDPDSKITMAYAKTAEGAVWFEINFQNVFEVVLDPQYANQVKQTSTGFDTTGRNQTDEAKKKMGEAKTGEKNPNFGKTPSEKTKQKIKEGNTGKTRTEETKQLMSVSQTGKKLTAKTKQLLRDSKKGRKHYVNSAGETRMSRESPGPEWQLGRRWKG
jgi:hypothetical protein